MSGNSTQLAVEAKNTSTPSFVTSLVLNGAVFAAEIIVFTLVRKHFKAIYEPRTFIPPEDKRMTPIGDKLLAWPLAVFNADIDEIKHQNGMDAFVFVKYLRMMVRVFLPIWILSWVILIPVDTANTLSPGKTGLDRLTFGNIAPNRQGRYSAHIILAYLFTGWILWNIWKEMREFIVERQLHLVDPEHSASAQARTVLVTGVPRKFLNEKALTQLFSYLPGGVQKVWLNRDLKALPDLYKRRLKASNKLEAAETALLSTAAKLRRTELKNANKGKTARQEKAAGTATGVDGRMSLAEQLVPTDKRPTHRLPVGFLPFSLPFLGEQVDSIEWARKEIAETSKELDTSRLTLQHEIRLAKVSPVDDTQDWKKLAYPPLSSAFILFHQQIAAHLAAQTLTHNLPYRMADKYSEVAPADVIWANLSLNPYEARIRRLLSYAATAGLIVLWAFPVAFVGIVSNIAKLCTTYKWLAWLCRLPGPAVGLIQGVLPPVLLAVLMALLPIVLRLLARFEGIPRRTGLELSLMTRFFIFQVVHGFLIVTLSSGIIAALGPLVKNPTSIPTLLAQNLPEASTFFITFAILQGLAGSAAGFLQAVPLVLYYVKLYVFSSTPRAVYKARYDLRDVAWGQLFPSITLLVVICTAYSIISPVINGFACVSFFLFYQMWKYNFLWQLDQPRSGDTGGLFFPKAIQHTFVGLYIQEICLAALFFLARDERGRASAVPEGALMIVLFIITTITNMIVNDSYGPLLYSLPLTLAHKSYGMPQSADVPDVRIGEDAESDDASADETPASPPAEDTATRKRAEFVGQDGELRTGKQPVREGFAHGEGVGDEGKHNEDPADFDHPAAVEPQRIVWIPEDELGLGAAEARACNDAFVLASTDHARMDARGRVTIDSHPPGVTTNLFSA